MNHNKSKNSSLYTDDSPILYNDLFSQRNSCQGSNSPARLICCRCSAHILSTSWSSRFAITHTCCLINTVRECCHQRFGLKWYLRNPNSFTPLHNGQRLLLGREADKNKAEIAKFSVWHHCFYHLLIIMLLFGTLQKKDAGVFADYEHFIERMGLILGQLFL